MQAGARGEIDAGRALTRVTAFSDGVFAIAITLLVLNLDVPRLSAAEQHRLAHDLIDQWPDYLAWALSFVIIARFWVVHDRLFARMARLDERAMVANFAYLAAVVLIPFASEVLGEYPDRVAAVVTYALVVGGATLLAWLLIHHALAGGLIREADRPETRVYGDRAALMRPALFALSIPVAFVSTGVAQMLWVATFLVGRRRR
jgi:uncharacterized membrane protein